MPYTFLPIPKGFQRLDPFPLDSTNVFNTLSDLQAYASDVNNTAYPGQFCAVISNEKLYIIKQDRTLKEIIDTETVNSGIISLSSFWNSVYTTVNTNSSKWIIDNNVRALTGNYNSVYSIVNTNSADWNIDIDLGVRALTGDYNSVYSIVNTNSADWNIDIDLGVKALTGNYNSVYTTVNTNSADWNIDIDLGVRALTGNYNSVYSVVNTNSANYNSVYTTVNTNSADWNIDIDLGVRALTGNYNSVYSVVNTNSANYNSVYTTVNTNSADWNIDIDLGVRALTGDYNSTYTTVNTNSADWNIDIDLGVRALTGNYNSVYSVVNTNSANYNSVYTTVNTNSADWNIDIDLGVRALTGNYNSVYSVVNTNSANYNSVYSIVNTNSADWNIDIDLGVRALTGDYNSTYTTVNTNSADWKSSISEIQEYFDDFITLGGDGTTLPNAFLKKVNTRGTIYVTPEDQKQGVLVITTNPLPYLNQRAGVTSDNTIHFGQNTDYTLIFSARRGAESFNISTSGIIEMGFHDQIGTDNVSASNGCYFASQNNENWKCISTTNGYNETTQTLVPCNTAWNTFQININKDASLATFKINNLTVATHVTYIPKDNNKQTAIGYRCFRFKDHPVNVELRLDWQSLIVKRQNKLWL